PRARRPARGDHPRRGARGPGTGCRRARDDVRGHGRGGRRHGRGARLMAMSRREARRAAVFMLFQWDVTGQPLGTLYDGEPDEWTRQIAEGVAADAPALDERITAAAEGWTADRLGAVERNVLRVAIHELDAGQV